MIITAIYSVIVVWIVFTLYLLYGKEHKKVLATVDSVIIKVVKNVVLPSIINEQSYFFVKTKYRNMVFSQCIRSNDYVSNEIKNTGKWSECQEIYDIYMSGSRDGIFIDFGANIGSCSFVFAQAGIKVYAFEPLPNNLYPFSLTTFSNTNFTKYITIYPYALGKEEKDQVMKITKWNWGSSSLYFNYSDYKEIIHVKKLDQFDKLIPTKISMIKIDVESAEYDLLEGGREFFKTHKTEFIHMEAHCGKRDKDGRYEIENLFEILNKMGYDIVRKFDCKIVEMSNIVAKRKK